LQVRVLPGPPMISMGWEVRRSSSNQWNKQFLPRPVANEMRRRPPVIGMVVAVDPVQRFDAHAQKPRRFPFVDPIAHQPSGGRVSQRMGADPAPKLGQLSSSFKCGLHGLDGSAVPLDEMLAGNSFVLPTAEMSRKPRLLAHSWIEGITVSAVQPVDARA
jgi:hypothetical protein